MTLNLSKILDPSSNYVKIYQMDLKFSLSRIRIGPDPVERSMGQ